MNSPDAVATFDHTAWVKGQEAQLVKLAKSGPGWHAYADGEAKRLGKEWPREFGHLRKVVQDAIKEANNA